MSNKLRVAVIFGGRSGEHEVSLVSAASVMNAIDKNRYEIVPIGITKEGKWLVSGDPMRVLTGQESIVGKPSSAIVVDPTQPALIALEPNGTTRRNQRIDVVIPILHGPYGEDGTVQGLLELAGVPYVGAGVLASAVGMDKGLMKTVFAQSGIPIVDFLTVLKRDWLKDAGSITNRIQERLGFPCFVKPACLGSSVGISKVRRREEMGAAMQLAGEFDRKIVVEKAAIDVREIECSVLGNDDPIVSVPGEIVPCNEFYDYRAKYVDEGSQLIIPADLPEATDKIVRHWAREAYKAIDCAGMARVDFFVSRDGKQVLVNEINTIPGFTSISMYPKLWEATGVTYAELIDRLIELALERHSEKSRIRTSYDAD